MLSNPPGIEDIFPDQIDRWNFIVDTARDVCRTFNYKEIIIPVLEYTEVFARGLGDETDIVSKEMFTFEDRGGRSLTLRPEGTASVVRAYAGNGDYNRLAASKFFYFGPMFRAERPQKGRLRQFNQFGVEFFGSSHPYYDYEVIAVMDAVSKRIGVGDYELLLNSIGCPECRGNYIRDLENYYRSHVDELCDDCRRRLEKNTLRLLDCKQEGCNALKKNAPVINEYLCETCVTHHSSLKELLTGHGISFKEDPHLVRGLDYYTKTTFEFVTTKLGGQNAFAAGGRYDNLVELFGGKPTPAVGFAAGIERIMLIIQNERIPRRAVDAYIIHSGNATLSRAIELAEILRKNGISADIDPNAKGFKNQFKKADRENAKFSLIIGEEEIEKNSVTLKHMSSGDQQQVEMRDCVEALRKSLNNDTDNEQG